MRSYQHAFHLQIDGQDLLDRWEWQGGEERAGGREGELHVIVSLKHAVRPVSVRIHTLLDGTSFLTRWVEVINHGEKPAACSKADAWAGQVWAVGDVVNAPLLTDKPFSLGRFKNTEWSTEGDWGWENLPGGHLSIDHRHGLSGHGCPFVIMRNEITGEALAVHVEWSGNWQMAFYNDYEDARGLVPADLCPLYRSPVKDARLYFRAGVAGRAPLRLVMAG